MLKWINKKQVITQQFNQIDYYDIIVVIDSLFALKDGWNMKYSDKGYQTYLQKKNMRSCVIGVVGNANKGKTFVLQKLSGTKLPSGFNICTEGLSVKYPTIKEKNVILLDTAGFETPLKHDKKFNFDKSIDYIEQYKLIKSAVRNKQLVDIFLQKFILFQSDIIIIVVDQLTYSDQKLISRIKAEHFYCKKQKQKGLFVVHNLMNLETISQVKDYIEETLLLSLTFTLKQNTYLFFNEVDSTQVNTTYYVEEVQDAVYQSVNIVHLIMSRVGTEAGDYYNGTTIEFIRNSCASYVNISKFPLLDKIKHHLFSLSKEIIENPIRIEDIQVEEKAIRLLNIRNSETGEAYSGLIKLNKCFIDEIGNSLFARDTFTPAYSYYILDDDKLLVLELEISGEIKSLTAKPSKIGNYHCFEICGEKITKTNLNRKMFYSSIESGRFILDVLIPATNFYLSGQKIYKHTFKSGIVSLSYKIEINDDKDSGKEIILENEEEVVETIKKNII